MAIIFSYPSTKNQGGSIIKSDRKFEKFQKKREGAIIIGNIIYF